MQVFTAVAGLTSDANILVQYARLAAQRYRCASAAPSVPSALGHRARVAAATLTRTRHRAPDSVSLCRYTYGEEQPVEQLVTLLCDYKHGYTQYGGLRPFGVSFLYAGWDRHFGFQMYQSDPSGNYSGWKATAIGSNSQSAQSTLKSDYTEDLSLTDATKLAVRVLGKAMDTTNPTAEKMEVRGGGGAAHRRVWTRAPRPPPSPPHACKHLARDSSPSFPQVAVMELVDGVPRQRMLSAAEIDGFIKEAGLVAAAQ